MPNTDQIERTDTNLRVEIEPFSQDIIGAVPGRNERRRRERIEPFQ